MTNIQFQRGAVSAGECISSGWAIVSRNLLMYIGIGLLTFLLIGCIPIINFILMGPVLGGFYYVVLRDYRGEPVDFGMMFKGFEKFVPLMVVGLIQSVPGIITQFLQFTVDIAQLAGTRAGAGSANFYQASSGGVLAGGMFIAAMAVGLAFFVFSIAWFLCFQFTIPLIMEHNLGVGDAIKLSIRAGFANAGGLILLLILETMVAILGVLVLCVGLLVAIPVIYAATAMAYRQVFPAPSADYYDGPPPPNAYGNFGRA